jgi:hypothetical protein
VVLHPLALKEEWVMVCCELCRRSTQKYEGNQWWQWALWIQGTEEDLEKVNQ